MNHAVNDGSVYLPSSLFPVILPLFTLTVLQVGILVALGYLVSVIFQPIIGRYAENRDPSRLLASGVFIIAISITSFIFSTGFSTLLASVVLLRIGSSFFHPIGISAVSRTYAGPGLQRAMGFQSAFGNLGVLLIFLTAGTVYTFVGWQLTFIMFSIVAIVDVIVTLTALRSSRPPTVTQLVKPIAESNGKKTRIPIYFLVIAFVSGGSYAVVLNFANLFLGNHHPQLSVSGTDLIVSSFIVSAALGALSTGLWTRRVQTGWSLGLSYLFSSMAIIIFALAPENLSLAIIALLGCGFLISATYPLTYTALSNHIVGNSHRSGSWFGALSSAQTVGASVMGLVTGLIVSGLGPASPFFAVGIMMLLACFATILQRRQGIVPVQTPETVESIPRIDPAQKLDNCD
jgi:FSR family fosmidomycin resistance protein-like MFS transporter